MFPEYRALISRLKKDNTRFAALFHEHNILDAEIKNLSQKELSVNR
ncbi:TPA: hypothetical protein G9X39_002646 [Salmonella enterica subsp. enterica serovar Panama]|uniref:DUF465 domain-containing protein n=1 Tax=Salmonella enterica subsp. enterica serovar Panama TaxID=29472 RepID=A0A751YX56_SALET|nr:hypothetical protein [Salmonella enterica subsp. enterica serovar Panama]